MNTLNGNNRFKFTLADVKFRNTVFERMTQSVTLPGLSLGLTAIQTPVREVQLPGNSLDIDQLTVRFLVDENLESWFFIYDWILSIRDNSNINEKNIFTDASLILLSNTYKPIINYDFENLFPISISEIEYSTDGMGLELQHATVAFKFTDISVTREPN